MNFANTSLMGNCAAVLVVASVLVGCRDESPGEQSRRPSTSSNSRGGLFEAVADNLDHLEQFETEQIHKQTCDRLNQWYLQETPQVEWRQDPLVEGLSDSLREGPAVASLEPVRFQTPEDAWFLQEAVWLRNISNGARADQFQDLAVAKRLFDWTVRNIQLEDTGATGEPETAHWPYETLLLGRGTAIERAWVFILLARQQGLDAVMLGLADSPGQSVRPWLPALLLADDLYLFDSRLGLPIPGLAEGSVATLAEALADEQILRKLDLDEAHPYPVRAKDLKHVVALVEGSPASLSRRMALVESRLAGKNKMRLTSPGSALAERVAKLPGVHDAQLWSWPFEVAQRKANLSQQQQAIAAREMFVYQALPPLWLGRALQFKGEYDGQQGAKANYLGARPTDQQIEDYKLPDQIVKQVPRNRLGQVEAAHILMMREAKQNASFWIGLIFFDQEDYPNAIDFLAKRTLGTGTPSRWATSARYNLARAYEAQGKLSKAIELYEADTAGPQSHGNQLRARWLKEKSAAAADEPEST